jgi:hypothetical protein
MSETINIDRFTRLKQSLTGEFSPHALPGLADYLAGEEGEIKYSLTGNLRANLDGSQERCVKCIIYGWILLSDPVTLAAVRYPLDIHSSLVLAKDESELPPLENESANEDYIVCGAEMDIALRVEEEILLSLPVQAVNRREMIESHADDVKRIKQSSGQAPSSPANSNKILPFARLADLKATLAKK